MLRKSSTNKRNHEKAEEIQEDTWLKDSWNEAQEGPNVVMIIEIGRFCI